MIDNLPLQVYGGLRQAKRKKHPKNETEQIIKLSLLIGLIIVKIALILYYSLR